MVEIGGVSAKAKVKGEMKDTDPLVGELEAIKRLLVVMLVKAGATQDEIADALQVSSRTVRNQFSFSKYKRPETV